MSICAADGLADLLVDCLGKLHPARAQLGELGWKRGQRRDLGLEPFNRLGLLLAAHQLFLGALPLGDLVLEEDEQTLLLAELALDVHHRGLGHFAPLDEAPWLARAASTAAIDSLAALFSASIFVVSIFNSASSDAFTSVPASVSMGASSARNWS